MPPDLSARAGVADEAMRQHNLEREQEKHPETPEMRRLRHPELSRAAISEQKAFELVFRPQRFRCAREKFEVHHYCNRYMSRVSGPLSSCIESMGDLENISRKRSIDGFFL